MGKIARTLFGDQSESFQTVDYTDDMFLLTSTVAVLSLDDSIRVRYRKGPGWTGLDTNNLFLLNCRRERQTNPNPNPNPNPGPLR